MSYVILPSRSLRQPAGRLVVRPEIAAIAEAVIDCRSQAHAAELTTGRAVTRGSSGGTTEQSVYGYRNRFPGNSTNSYWAVPITAIGTGEFTILFGDVRYNAYAVDSLQGYCCDFNSGSYGAPALTHSANTTSLCWYDGGSVYTTGITANGGNVNVVSWRRAPSTSLITASLGQVIGTTTVYAPQNIAGTTWNVGGFKALGNGALHPNFSLGYALLLRRWADDTLLRDIAANPYGAVFRADPARRIFLGPAAGGATTDAAIAGTQATDVGAIAVQATTGAALAGTQASDVGAVAVAATTGCAIAGTQTTDVAAVNVSASTGSGTDADIAGTQAPDVGAISVSATLGLAIAGTQASDLGYIVVSATVVASMAGTQSSDVAAIVVAGSSIWTDVGVSAATWSDVGGASSIWTDL
jgi:hypothetical protein